MINLIALHWKVYEKGLTRKEIGKALGFSPQLISMALSGKRPKQLPKIAKFIREYKPK